MIKINLALKKQAMAAVGKSSSSSSGSSLSASLGSLSDLKELPLGKLALPVVIFLGGYVGLSMYETQLMDEATQTAAQLQAERDALQPELLKTKTYSKIKEELEFDKLVLSTKIQTINKLIDGREISFRMMLEISKLIPDEVWRTRLKVDKKTVGLTGELAGINLMGDFVQRLDDSPFFKSVIPGNTAKIQDSEELQKFEMSMEREAL